MRATVGAWAIGAFVGVVACKHPAPPTPTTTSVATIASASSSISIASISRAEERRDARSIPPAAIHDPSVAVRRAAARAFAEINGSAAHAPLLAALADEDDATVGWAAYGLGLACELENKPAGASSPSARSGQHARNVAHAEAVRAIAARAQTYPRAATSPLTPMMFDAWDAMAWSLGRCGGAEAARTLARWLEGGDARAKSAAIALGSIAAREHGLEDEVVAALVDAAKSDGGHAAIAEALHPFSRGDWSARARVPALDAVVRAQLHAGGDARIFALRAAHRARGIGVVDLRTMLTDAGATANEQVEALRALHRLGAIDDDTGALRADAVAAIAAFATRALPANPADFERLATDAFSPMRVAIELLADDARGPTERTALSAVAAAMAPAIRGDGRPTIVRRAATLRCTALAGLDAAEKKPDLLRRCADLVADSPPAPAPLATALVAIATEAELHLLERHAPNAEPRAIIGATRDAVVGFARAGHPRTREHAIALLAEHAETGAIADVVAAALGDPSLGVASAAAEAMTTRPSIAFGLTRAAIRRALDPRASAPTIAVHEDTGEIADAVVHALDKAIARPLEDADAEAKIAFAGAVRVVGAPHGHALLDAMCGDKSASVRAAARAAKDALSDGANADTCAAPIGAEGASDATPAIDAKTDAKIDARIDVKIETDVGVLKLHLSPTLAPRAVHRWAELVAQKFFDGTPIHRVAPAFVVQLGDPGGDGFGGAHQSLRCETAPVAFDRLDIGVALAGRDTGSSQIFVMLAPAPHLDGSYAWLGHAEGDWDAVAEGDTVIRATLE